MNGRVVFAGVLVAAAYVKGRIDAAYETGEAASRTAQSDRAVAETAATLAPEWVAPPTAVAAPEWVAPPVPEVPSVEEIRPGWRGTLERVTARPAPAPLAAGHAATARADTPPAAEPSFSEWETPVSVTAPAPAVAPVRVTEPSFSEWETPVSVATPPPAATPPAAEPTFNEWETPVSLTAPASAAAPAVVTEPSFNEWETPVSVTASRAAAPAPAAHEPAVNEFDAPLFVAPSAVRETEPAVSESDAPVPADAAAPEVETWVEETPAPAAEPVARGDFFVSGLASAAGDLAFGRVLFPQRLDAAPEGATVTLVVEASDNLPDGGVAVMTDGGFAPCVEGMTLVAAAAGPGRFVARGHYVVGRPDAQ